MTVGIIGAGASGLVCAIYAAKSGNDVILIERNQSPAKKILITGNGKCNYFNSDMNINHYHSDNNDILEEIITDKNINEVLNFFESIGIVPMIKNGYYYPYSNKAVSIKDALIKECQLLGVNIITDFKVEEIIKKDKFEIKSDNDVIEVDKVVLATGSKAYPNTGSDGIGYEIASSFEHKIIKVLPALTGLCTLENLNNISGVRHEVKLSLLQNDNLLKEEIGQVQFTDYGISGICVFNLSSLVSKGIAQNLKEEVVINFIPYLNLNTIEEVIQYLEDRSEKVTGRTLFELLEGILDYKLIKLILEKSNIDPEKYLEELNKKEKYHLAQNLFSFKLNIKGTKSFDSAQTCIGGVPLNEINPLTMESKLVNDLYIVGELLDVNGDCGGYNLAFAFISGMIAGKGIR